MTTPFTFFSIISELLSEANEGLFQAFEASKDQEVVFVIPQIEIQLKCTVIGNDMIGIVPSNATESNYYGDRGESELKLTFKPKP